MDRFLLSHGESVWCKSFVFSFLSIRKVLGLPFAGAVCQPHPVVSLLFSVSYPQTRRSYYLFFNYLFFTTCFRVSRMLEELRGGVSRMLEESSGGGYPECSWKTPPHHWHLWINLAAAGDQDTVRSPRNDFQRCDTESPTRSAKAAVGPLRGWNGEPSGLAGLD